MENDETANGEVGQLLNAEEHPWVEQLLSPFDDFDGLLLVPIVLGTLSVVAGLEVIRRPIRWAERTTIGKFALALELPVRVAFGLVSIGIGAVGLLLFGLLASPFLLAERLPPYSDLVYEESGEQ